MPLYYQNLGVFETIKDNNFSLGLGGRYAVNGRFDINLAIVQTFWPKDNAVEATFPAPPYPNYDVTINNSITSLALGVNIWLGSE